MKKVILIMLLTLFFFISLVSTSSNASPPPVKKKTVEAAPVAKQEKVLQAQIQAVEAQLRFWKNQEKSKAKVGEITRLAQIIGQNVEQLWKKKLDLQDAAKNLNVSIPKQTSVSIKKKGKTDAEEEDE